LRQITVPGTFRGEWFQKKPPVTCSGSRFAASHVSLALQRSNGSRCCHREDGYLNQLADAIEMIGQHLRDSIASLLNGIIELCADPCISRGWDLHTPYINIIEENGTEVYQ
jgi:hypothetical protein